MDARALRKARGWSQNQMAEYLGCDQATVSRIENGQEPSGPVARLLKLLAEAPPSPPAPPSEGAAA